MLAEVKSGLSRRELARLGVAGQNFLIDPFLSDNPIHIAKRIAGHARLWNVTFVVHALVQDANDIDPVGRLTIKQNVRSGRVHAIASAHLRAFPA